MNVKIGILNKQKVIILMNFNERLKGIREDNDLSQTEIAKQLKITQQQYSLYESGKRTMPLDTLIAFCESCKVSADYLLGLSKDCKNPKILSGKGELK